MFIRKTSGKWLKNGMCLWVVWGRKGRMSRKNITKLSEVRIINKPSYIPHHCPSSSNRMKETCSTIWLEHSYMGSPGSWAPNHQLVLLSHSPWTGFTLSSTGTLEKSPADLRIGTTDHQPPLAANHHLSPPSFATKGHHLRCLSPLSIRRGSHEAQPDCTEERNQSDQYSN